MRASGAEEVGTGMGSDLSRGLSVLARVLRVLGFFGSSLGATMDGLLFADGAGETTRRREPRGGFEDE
jgi:hypothetical protein